MRRTVAFQGEPGAYSEIALHAMYGPDCEILPCLSFLDVFQAIENARADCGVIPIENSLAGSVHRNYDLLLRSNLHIVGEYHLRVRHCLLTLPGVSLESVRQVWSHPQALAQCGEWLERLNGIERVPKADTAGSARMIAAGGHRDVAAIASRMAAERYGMQIQAEGIEDDRANYTRFLALSPEPVHKQGEVKISIVFSLENKPGALFQALKVFAERNIDLTKIESRPIQGKPWEYMFYLDFVSDGIEGQVPSALERLGSRATTLRHLGTYQRHFWHHQR
ncbi:MAG: prephenate dehydratase [Anaerolineales bacterium]|nr:prephenate dehydratase [Anaerolineales bacterium]